MTAQLAKNKLIGLKRDRDNAAATIEEQKAQIEILDVQIAALEPLAVEPEPAPAKASV